jgi:hypothetical protein
MSRIVDSGDCKLKPIDKNMWYTKNLSYLSSLTEISIHLFSPEGGSYAEIWKL